MKIPPNIPARSIHLRRFSRQMQGLGSDLSGPALDWANVNRIRHAISHGKFTINTGVVADRLIADARALVAAGEK